MSKHPMSWVLLTSKNIAVIPKEVEVIRTTKPKNPVNKKLEINKRSNTNIESLE